MSPASVRAGVFARLAPVVVQAATDGEPVARDIMARAAAEIWQVAEALSDGDRGLTVHLSGGLGAVVAPYLRAHDPDRHWRPCSPDPLRGLSMMHRGSYVSALTAIKPSCVVANHSSFRFAS